MSGVCTEQHKFHLSSHHLSPKKTLRDIDIPPRKLHTRRTTATYDGAADMFSDDAIFQKFLPYNKLDDDDDDESDDPYSSDHFRMYEFKVRRCTRSRSHDWTDCPFAHPGEKARRRDPRRFHYSGTVCPEYRRGGCSRGDSCEFAHGVFECWLHPARYRTEACKDGKKCKRKVCFFAHTPRQLRILPVTSHNNNNNNYSSNENSSISLCKKNNITNKLFLNHTSGSRNNNCCLFCHHCAANSASPTSTLFNMSHFSPPMSPLSSSNSPPFSPVKRPVSGVQSTTTSYKDVLTEIMGSMEGFNFCDGSPLSAANAKAKARNMQIMQQQQQQQHPWLDVCMKNNCDDQQFVLSPSVSSSLGFEDHQFILSPSSTQTPTRSNVGKCSINNNNNNNFSSKFLSNDNNVVGAEINGSSCPAPDLGWVNELLM